MPVGAWAEGVLLAIPGILKRCGDGGVLRIGRKLGHQRVTAHSSHSDGYLRFPLPRRHAFLLCRCPLRLLLLPDLPERASSEETAGTEAWSVSRVSSRGSAARRLVRAVVGP